MADEAGKPGKPAGAGKSTEDSSANSAKAESNRRMLRVGIVALALIVGVIAWVATSDDDGDSAQEQATVSVGVEATIVSPGELEELVESAGHTVYWAGTIPGKELEASESETGNFQIRYLDEGTEAGGGGAGVLTIGSYPLPDPAAALEGFAERDGSLVRRSADGREVVTGVEKPTSVYFTGADGDVQVEVYDPNYKRAMSLALSDRVQPVG